MASSSALYDILIPLQTPIEPGAEVLSTVVDVRGSSEVHLTLSTPDADSGLEWVVLFGPTQSGRLVPTASGTFASATEAIIAPTFGVRMAVAVRNHGDAQARVDGNYYFVRA